MQSVLVVALLVAVVSSVLSKPTAGNDTVAQEQRDITSIPSDHHVIEKRDTPHPGCSKEMYATRGKKPVGLCNTGYARHTNGRCYRVVDKPPGGGALPEHEYQITRGTECYVFVPERNVVTLTKQETLDLCDEDGGCDKYQRIQAVKPIRPFKGGRNQ